MHPTSYTREVTDLLRFCTNYTILASPRSRSGGVAGDASTWPSAGLHSAAAIAAPRAHTAVTHHRRQDQPRHRFFFERE